MPNKLTFTIKPIKELVTRYVNGIGLKRGFEMIEILLVPHGGSKNDTIVTVERKSQHKLFE